jgi:hypothetical protein
MRNRSSIFSFNTLKGTPRPSASLWIALALMVAVRIVLLYTGPAMIRATDGWIKRDFGNFYRVAGQTYSGDRPVIFASGSSRLGLGLHQKTVSRLTGHSIGKAALSASSPWEILKLLEINEDLLDNIDMLIFDMQAYQFNDNCPTRFRRGNNLTTFSSWRERTALNGSFFAVEMAKDLWPVHRERMTFESALALPLTVASEKAQFKPMDARWPAFKTSRKMRETYKREYFQPATVVERHMNDFSYSEFMESAVNSLISLCRSRGITVIVIIPPATKEFTGLLRSGYPDGYKRILSFAESLNGDGVYSFIAETPADIGERERGFFMDYGHMTEEGAAKYTKWLTRKMKEAGAI